MSHPYQPARIPSASQEVPLTSLNIVRRRQLHSRESLAKAAGVSESTIYLIEKGKTRPRLGVMRKLAAALGIDPMEVDEFRLTVDEPERTRPAA